MKFSEFKYERIDVEETSKHFTQLLDNLEKQKDGQGFIKVFKEIEEEEKRISSMAVLASIRHTINTKDEFYEKENDFWDDTLPLLNVFTKRFSDIALAYPNRQELYSYIPETFFQLAECAVKSFDEKIVPLLQQENKLASEYGKLKASAQIEFNGQTYNLSSIRPLTESDDRETRKAAYDAKVGFYQANEKEFDRIYDELVKVRTEMAHQLGYKTFTELAYYRMSRLDYNQDMVANYRKQIIEDIVPVCKDLYASQAKRLGLDKLAYYDIAYEFKTGNAKPKGSSDDLINAAVNMYHEMSKETGEFIDIMKNQELWDLISRDGKEMGGYTNSIDIYHVPFIFANFNGTSGDVDVLTHEAGHAFQYYMSRDIGITECQWPTMESCEIHSMSMEFFAYPWIENFFKEDTAKYKYYHLASTLKFLPYGCLVDHYQHEVYNHPEMTADERKTTWRKLEKIYCPERDFTGCDLMEKGCYWYQQGHIFQSPFYYIDYCLAQICALQFWARTQRKDPKAFSDYLDLCKLGGTKSFVNLVKAAKLNVPFEDGCVKTVAQEAKEYLHSIDDSKL